MSTELRAKGGSGPSIFGFRTQRVLTGLGPHGAGLWAVPTDTQTNQEPSLTLHQLDRVTADGKQEIQTPVVCVCVVIPLCVYYCIQDGKHRSHECRQSLV